MPISCIQLLLGNIHIFCAWVGNKWDMQESTNTLYYKTSSNGSRSSTLVCLWCIGDTFFTCIYIYIYWCFYLAFKGLPHLLWIRKSRRQCSSDLLNVNLHGGHVINGLNGALLSWCWASYPTNILCSTHFRSSPFMSAHETGQWQALYTAYILAHTGWSAWILFIGDGPLLKTCWFFQYAIPISQLLV